MCIPYSEARTEVEPAADVKSRPVQSSASPQNTNSALPVPVTAGVSLSVRNNFVSLTLRAALGAQNASGTFIEFCALFCSTGQCK